MRNKISAKEAKRARYNDHNITGQKHTEDKLSQKHNVLEHKLWMVQYTCNVHIITGNNITIRFDYRMYQLKTPISGTNMVISIALHCKLGDFVSDKKRWKHNSTLYAFRLGCDGRSSRSTYLFRTYNVLLQMAFSRGCANALYHCGVCDKHTSDHGGIRSCDLVEQQSRPLRPAMFYTNDAELIGNDLIESGIKLTFNDHRSPVTVLYWDGRIHCHNTIAENRGNFCWLFGHRGTLYFIHLQWIFSDDDFFFGNIQRKLSFRPIEICDFVLTLYLRPWLHVT